LYREFGFAMRARFTEPLSRGDAQFVPLEIDPSEGLQLEL
jgi:hypothetical protein